jgi:hypothetical protein
MSIPDSITLRKAVKVATKIERLQEKLHALLGDTLELPSHTETIKNQLLEVAKEPRRRGRPPGSGRKIAEDGTRGPSKLAGRPRPASPSGPLAPAVVKVLQRYGRAMKVNEILIGLEHDNYIWTAKNPRQTLYVRIGKLAGVKKVDEGLYIADTLESAPVGIVPETVAPAAPEFFSNEYAAPAPVHEEPYIPAPEVVTPPASEGFGSYDAPSQPSSY